MSNQSVVISGSGLFTPENSISNVELVDAFNQFVDAHNAEHSAAIEAGDMDALAHSSSDFIVKASGIKSRFSIDKTGPLDPAIMHPLIPERSDSEQSLHCEVSLVAIKEALAQAKKSIEDVDAVIVSSAAQPRMYPALAIEIQAALGIDGYAYDMNVACSSATFGIQAAYNSIRSGMASCVVVVNPEITSPQLNYRDRDSHFIFGDVCTAVVVESVDKVHPDAPAFGIVDIELKTSFSNTIRNNFGYMNRCATDAKTGDKLFYQEGRKVFKEVVPMVSSLIVEHLKKNTLEADQLKRLWLHQANINMNVLIGKKVMGRDVEFHEAPIILDRYANTSSAGSIIAFHLNKEDFVSGDKGLICSFGAGYSIGNIIVERQG
ncbi:MAG: beta-ketoacyl-ACP synthase III [Pseudomonadota bacterium]